MLDAAFQFRHCLYGRKFTFITDHRPLVWLHKVKEPSSRLKRFYFKLREFDYTITYKPGKQNYVADALSRNPPTVEVDKVFMPIPTEKYSDTMIARARTGRQPSKRAEQAIQALLPRKRKAATVVNETDEEIPSLVDSAQQGTVTEEDIQSSASQGHHYNLRERQRPKDVNNDDLEMSLATDIFDLSPVPYELDKEPENRPRLASNIVEIRDKFTMAKNTCMYFVTKKNQPLCTDAKSLQEENRLLVITDCTLGRVKVTQVSGTFFVALVVKENLHDIINQEIFDETFVSLLDFLIECKPPTLRIAKTNFQQIKTLLEDQVTKLIICLGLVQTPAPQDRIDIIRDVHEVPVNGHKGVAKTYQRIRQDYFWPNMKKQIQNVIAECKICHLNKLVRKKVR